jgi:hypothetical protein
MEVWRPAWSANPEIIPFRESQKIEVVPVLADFRIDEPMCLSTSELSTTKRISVRSTCFARSQTRFVLESGISRMRLPVAA